MPRCSIIIPVFNKASLTIRCLDTLLATPPAVSFEIILVDDASTDVTPQALASYGERIRVLRHDENTGFSTACNDGAKIAAGELLIFLNNDTLPQPDWLDALVLYAEAHPEAAVVGSKMLFPDRTIQHAGVVIAQDRYARHLYAGFPADHPAVNKSRRFQIVTAACALFRQAPFEMMGGFDPAFCNGNEDVDLCLRFGEAGCEIHYCHESVLIHLESVSQGRFSEVERNTQLYRERWMHKVKPDDLAYYVEDGLLQIGYAVSYPIHFTIAPELGVLMEAGRERKTERLLNRRARQVGDLLRDNISLTVRLWESQLNVSASGPNGSAAPARDLRTLPTEPPRLICEGEVHWMSKEPNGRVISVLMPVKNGAARLRELLPCVLRQKTRDSIEIVAVDSGSPDGSVDVLREFGATVIAIDPASFNHGLTRQLAARYAKGDVYVFLNQSASPAGEDWLANLVAPLAGDPQLAGVCSRVLPGDDADPLARKDGLRDPSGSPDRSVRSIVNREEYARLPHHQLRLLINFHTVSAAIRPSVLAQVPFREVTSGEDILWAKEVLEAGFKIQHEPGSIVRHSHSYSAFEILQRNVDDGRANKEIVGRRLTETEVIPTIRMLVEDDWAWLERECEVAQLDHWRIESALRRTAQIVGQWIGVNHERLPADLVRTFSLTEQIKARHRPGHAPAAETTD